MNGSFSAIEQDALRGATIGDRMGKGAPSIGLGRRDHAFRSGWPIWWRSLALLLLLLLSIVLYTLLIRVNLALDAVVITPFLRVWMLCFVPYVVASGFVLLTKPATGRWRWVELGSILVGALVLRAMLLPEPPNLSHDSWRYLWDARVTLHGYSPYVYPPWDKVFLSLRDVIYENSRFRNVPTIYPPGAQVVYLLSYLIAPSNLYVLKGIFIAFDMVTCGALALLLARKELDPRRVIIYAWCPLPIVEFAIEGHVDAITIMFTVLAVLCATYSWRGARALTGFLIGMATLTKIYPIFLLVVIVRRRDWALLISCLVTIMVGYIPFLMLGHGQVLGYFSTYSSEQGGNAGVVQLVTYMISHGYGFPLAATVTYEHIVDVIVVVGMSVVVVALRLFGLGRDTLEIYPSILKANPATPLARLPMVSRAARKSLKANPATPLARLPMVSRAARKSLKANPATPLARLPVVSRVSMEATTLLLIGTILAISSHVFPWYTTALLPWIAVLIGPLWTRHGPSGKGLAVLMAWYFTIVSLSGYFFKDTLDWHIYYWSVYAVVMAGLTLALAIGFWRWVRYWHRLTIEGRHT